MSVSTKNARRFAASSAGATDGERSSGPIRRTAALGRRTLHVSVAFGVFAAGLMGAGDAHAAPQFERPRTPESAAPPPAVRELRRLPALPPLTPPTALAAQVRGPGVVQLSWQPVIGAAEYLIEGPGPAQGQARVGGAESGVTLSNVPPGPSTWRVTTLGSDRALNAALAATVSTVVRYAPRHAPAWLTKPWGPGDPATMSLHATRGCLDLGNGNCFQALFAESSLVAEQTGRQLLWGNVPYRSWVGEAVYANTTDLGFGRRTKCFQRPFGQPRPGVYTVCYATNHGPSPGLPGFADPRVITRAAAGEDAPPSGSQECYIDPAFHYGYPAPACPRNPWGSLPQTVSVIVKGPPGTLFLVMSIGRPRLLADEGSYILENGAWVEPPAPRLAVVFDSEGTKHAPQACLACHGGRLDMTTGWVQGATLLPIDPNLMAFGTTQPGDRVQYERAAQEENIRRVNMAVLMAGASPAVNEYLAGLYNGRIANPGATAINDYVPKGWLDQAGLYRAVVRPYCTTCHLATRPEIAFSTWGNFQKNAALVHTAVCRQKSMPHAELAFRQFWTKDTGPLFLPGLLAASLGYASCS